MKTYRKAQMSEQYYVDVYEYAPAAPDEYGGFEKISTEIYPDLEKAKRNAELDIDNASQVVTISDKEGVVLFVGAYVTSSYREYPGSKQWTDENFKLYDSNSKEGREWIEHLQTREKGAISEDLRSEMEERELEEAALRGDVEPIRPEASKKFNLKKFALLKQSRKFKVVDSDFNRANYPDLIGKIFDSPPAYANVVIINEDEENQETKTASAGEIYDPKLESDQAKALWFKVSDYLLFSDDPKYEAIKTIRKLIDKLENPNDKEEMKKYFESEFEGHHTREVGAWEYYK